MKVTIKVNDSIRSGDIAIKIAPGCGRLIKSRADWSLRSVIAKRLLARPGSLLLGVISSSKYR